jgi:Ca2+-binding RTX toxin-like protein
MTTWPSLRGFLMWVQCAVLSAIALLGTAIRADAAVTAIVAGSRLHVAGDDADNQIILQVVSGGLDITVRNGATVVGTFARSSFTSIQVDAGGGDDELLLLFSFPITITEPLSVDGGTGNDHLRGGWGNDTIRGGEGNDVIEAGVGDDILIGGGGDDRFVWWAEGGLFTPNDGSDSIDGEAGWDTLEAHGTSGADVFNLAPGGGVRLLLALTSPALSLSVGTTESLDMDMRGGDDRFNTLFGLPTTIVMRIDGGDGDDIIFGGTADDALLGGGGNDYINGHGGSDIIVGGDGNDTLVGETGDDSLVGNAGNDQLTGGDGEDRLSGNTGADSVDGGAGGDVLIWNSGDGNDTLVSGGPVADRGDVFEYHGSAAAEQVIVDHTSSNVVLIASTGNLMFTNIGRIDIATLGGNDVVTVNGPLAGLVGAVTIDTGTGDDHIHVGVGVGASLSVHGGTAELDTLHVRAFAQAVDVRPTSIWVGNDISVAYSEIEALDIFDTLGALPSVTIATPTSAPATTSATSFITISGGVTDDAPLSAVTWVNNRGGSGTAAGTNFWTIRDVPLQPGANVITISSLDASGNRHSDTITVTVSTLTYSLAEGATGSFFDLDVLIANPTSTPAPATVTFLRQDGAPIVQNMTIAPTSRTTLHVDQIPGLENQGGVSTVVTSTTGVPLVVERTMFWDQSYYGSHGGTAVDGPRTRWLFAEGSEGFFNTFVLLANANAAPATVTVTFLREGSTPFVKQVNVAGNARATIAAGASPELVGRSFSIVVDSTQPIIAERAMYFGAARLFDGGHESAGVPQGAQVWFLAEGATGTFFETFVLIGNPNPDAATVEATFLTDRGESVVRSKTVPANGRLTINIEAEDPLLANAAVSTAIVASQPVVVERAMYWPGPPSTWAEAHNSFGSTFVAPRWGLAEGRVGMDHGFETYILLANPNTTAANVSITFLRGDGTTVVKTFTVNPRSRFNVAVSTAAPELQNEAFGALIQVTNGLSIGVERAMYSNALGQIWAAGTNALATRLP